MESKGRRIVTIEEVIAAAEERRAYVVEQRAKGRTLIDLADELGISHERVRQIERAGGGHAGRAPGIAKRKRAAEAKREAHREEMVVYWQEKREQSVVADQFELMIANPDMRGRELRELVGCSKVTFYARVRHMRAYGWLASDYREHPYRPTAAGMAVLEKRKSK